MDPVSIVGLVGASTAIAARVADLISAIPRLITSYRDTERSIRRLGSQLELFQGTVTELGEWLQRPQCVSERVKNTLNASLVSCREVIDDMEAHIKKVMPPEYDGYPSIPGRTRHVWDESCVNLWEQRVLNQMQMMDIYIRMLHLSKIDDQDSVLDSKSAVTAIERSNEDAKTVRSTWGEDTVTRAPSQKARLKKQVNRRSMMAMFKSFTLVPSTRRWLTTELVAACRNRNMTRIHGLIGQGASPNDAAEGGVTPLISAIRTGQFAIIETMLQYGAQANTAATLDSANRPAAQHQRTLTPLTAAIETEDATLVKLLIQYGAEVVCKSASLRPPLFQAIESDNADVVAALLEAGADSEIHTFGGEIKSSHGNGYMPELGTPLFFALGRANLPVVRKLLDYGADVNQVYSNPDVTTKSGKLEFTPLCYVLARGHAKAKDLFQLLLDRGADLDRRCGTIHAGTFHMDLKGVFRVESGENALQMAKRRVNGTGEKLKLPGVNGEEIWFPEKPPTLVPEPQRRPPPTAHPYYSPQRSQESFYDQYRYPSPPPPFDSRYSPS
ncbi:hypothetical protein ACHAPT_011042 [Fusarium lateritium]